jgi:hypothetical protein
VWGMSGERNPQTAPLEPALPNRCGECGGTVAQTEAGWTHVDRHGMHAGWLCPAPHMSLARPEANPNA